MNTDRETSNINVIVPDLSSTLEQALRIYNEAHPDKPATAITVHRFGIVRTQEGIYAMDEDGVGSRDPISERNPLEIGLYAQIPGEYTVFPYRYISLKPEHLNEHEYFPVKERVPLEKFIRVFSARLESNYRTWLADLRRANVTNWVKAGTFPLEATS